MTGDWTTPVKTVDAVVLGSATDSYGDELDLLGVKADHTAQYVFERTTGDTGFATLEGSLDGANWFSIGGNGGPGSAATGPDTITVNVNVTDRPCRYFRVRANATFGAPVLTVHNASC